MNRSKSSVSVHTIAALALVAVAAGYSLLTVSVRWLNLGFQPMTQVYLRIAFAVLFLLPLMWKRIRWHKIFSMPKRDLIVLLVMGTVGYSVAVYFMTLGAIHAKLINVAVIFATVPFFSYLYAFLFLHKRFNGKLILLLITSLVGIAIVATKSFIPHLQSFGMGEWFSLLATATMATYYVGRKLLSNHLNTSEITVTAMSIAAVSGWLLAMVRGETITISAFTNPTVLLGLGLGIAMNVLVNPLEIFSFAHLDAVVGSQILLLENVFTLVLGYVLFHEFISLPEIAGGCIIVGSVFIANILSAHET